MLSKPIIKLIQSLDQKKTRDEHNLFIVEGPKMTREAVMSGCKIHQILATREWIDMSAGELNVSYPAIQLINEKDLERLSYLKTPNQVLCLVEKPSIAFDPKEASTSLCLVLDRVQDPGNLGTIVRIADWFGIRDIICSLGTVDLYNPKVVQSTMGSLFRTRVHYLELEPVLKKAREEKIPVIGTTLEGEDIYRTDLPIVGYLVMGNESRGISPEIRSLLEKEIFVPSYPPFVGDTESLNVAVAAGITCAEFRRRT
jgi:RNA methyltransferase, TrmH family